MSFRARRDINASSVSAASTTIGAQSFTPTPATIKAATLAAPYTFTGITGAVTLNAVPASGPSILTAGLYAAEVSVGITGAGSASTFIANATGATAGGLTQYVPNTSIVAPTIYGATWTLALTAGGNITLTVGANQTITPLTATVSIRKL